MMWTRCRRQRIFPVRKGAVFETLPYKWFAWYPVLVRTKRHKTGPNELETCHKYAWLETVLRTDTYHPPGYATSSYVTSEYKEQQP